MHHKGECVLDKIDCINDSFIKPYFQGPSEILSALFGRHQEFLLCNLGWGRAFGLEGEFEVADDSIHHKTKDEILDTVKKADFELVRVEMFLERGNIYIFRLKK